MQKACTLASSPAVLADNVLVFGATADSDRHLVSNHAATVGKVKWMVIYSAISYIPDKSSHQLDKCQNYSAGCRYISAYRWLSYIAMVVACFVSWLFVCLNNFYNKH